MAELFSIGLRYTQAKDKDDLELFQRSVLYVRDNTLTEYTGQISRHIDRVEDSIYIKCCPYSVLQKSRAVQKRFEKSQEKYSQKDRSTRVGELLQSLLIVVVW